MKRILGVLLAGVLLLSGCGQWQKSQKESAYHLYCLDKTGTTLVQEPYEPKEGTDQKLIKELVDALQAYFGHCFHGNAKLCRPDFTGILLHPAGLRKDLCKFLLRHRNDLALLVK